MNRLPGFVVWPAALALGLAAEAVGYSWDEPRLWVPDLAVGLTFIACGRLVGDRRTGAGVLFAATGVTWFLGTFSADLLYLHRGPLVQLILAYPGVRPRSRLDGAAIAGGYAFALVAPADDSDVLTVAFALALVAFTGRAYAVTARPERRTALAAAVALAAVLAGGAALRLAFPGQAADAISLLGYDIVLIGIAIGLGIGLRRPAATTVADLVVELGETRSGVPRDRLARALGDPTLEVGYWWSEARAYVDDAGEPLALPGPGSGRTATRVERDGHPYAVLVHDAAVLDDPALVEAVASAARLTASNVALQAERRARANELVASRRRLLVAADRERRSLEGRLRRGPQRRLAEVEGVLAHEDGDEHLERARRQLARTLVDLHELARGLHPRELADAGLPGALASLAGLAPLPVDLEVGVERLPDEIEATVYFVCAEALANVAKYASASRVAITVEARDGDLLLSVVDDGIGGADRSRGTGLQGLADRVETLGGTLHVASPPGEGTRLTAEIPLAADPLPGSGDHGVRDRRSPPA